MNVTPAARTIPNAPRSRRKIYRKDTSAPLLSFRCAQHANTRMSLRRGVRPRTLDAVVVSVVPTGHVRRLARRITGGEEHTHGPRRSAIALEHVRVEELAVTGRLEHAVPPEHGAGAAGIAPVLRRRVRGALRRVVRAREEVAAHGSG